MLPTFQEKLTLLRYNYSFPKMTHLLMIIFSEIAVVGNTEEKVHFQRGIRSPLRSARTIIV